MSTGLAHDREIADEVIEGLEAAMQEEGLETEDLNQNGFGQQRLNKLVSCGLFWRYGEDPPIQYSWHRYGLDLGNAVKDYHLIRPHPANELPSFVQNQGATQERARRIEEYYHYFKTDFELGGMDLREAVLADFHDLLEAFYRRYADEEYRDLYLANVKLQRRLSQDTEELQPGEVDMNVCYEVGDIITEFHGELFALDVLRRTDDEFVRFVESHSQFDNEYRNLDALTEKTFDRVQEFTDLLEDIYSQLAESSEEDITGNPSNLLDSLNVFYHEYVWKQVTELVSIQTVSSRDRRELWKGTLEELEWLDQSYPEKMETHKQVAKDAGLVPSLDEFPFSDEDKETVETAEELASSYE